MNKSVSRQEFLYSLSMLAAGVAVSISKGIFAAKGKMKVVLVGTGVRGSSFWGKRLVDQYSDLLEFVALCDINPGRLAYAKKYMNVDCPVFTDFDEMLSTVSPDLIIVCTKDSNHHDFIIKGLDGDCDVLTEKPLTIDEVKAQAIIDAERRS